MSNPEITAPSVNDLGNVIKSAKIRSTIYAIYVIGLVILGAISAAFATLGGSPDWINVANSVMLYLGVPVGTLAAVNTGTRKDKSLTMK